MRMIESLQSLSKLGLTFLTFVVSAFVLWQLIHEFYLKDQDHETVIFLHSVRLVATLGVAALWVIWFLWGEKRMYQEMFIKVINNSPDAILTYDKSGKVTAVNKEAEKLFCGGGKELESVYDITPPEESVAFSKKLKGIESGDRLTDYETEKVLADGRRIPVSVGLVFLEEDNGKFIETIRDIRERVSLRNKIIELEKAQILAKMAEGVAHHMGTPLASMLLRVQMLKEDMEALPQSPSFAEKLESVERQIFYCQKVIQRLLRFARRPEKERRSERVSYLLEEGAEMMKPILKKHGIEAELHLDKDMEILGDSSMLELVFSDLMMNAVDAMPEGGRLTITASKDSEDLGEIRISDTGTGIPRDILPLVFEPFFTTKPAGKGTGLGLSVAKRIIQDHSGEISIESAEGAGTSVSIRLPIHTEEKAFA